MTSNGRNRRNTNQPVAATESEEEHPHSESEESSEESDGRSFLSSPPLPVGLIGATGITIDSRRTSNYDHEVGIQNAHTPRRDLFELQSRLLRYSSDTNWKPTSSTNLRSTSQTPFMDSISASSSSHLEHTATRTASLLEMASGLTSLPSSGWR